MVSQDPRILAAELRSRARQATPEERAELLFLAAEYERLAMGPEPGPLRVFLPK